MRAGNQGISLLRAWGVALAALFAASPPGFATDADLREQLCVMLQLENLLEAAGNRQFGARGAEVERQFELLREAGVRWARTGIMWEQIEPKPGQWNWAPADRVVKAAKQNHVKLLWLVGNTAPWDSSNREWNGVPRDLAKTDGHFPHFVHELVTRYKADIHHWEIRNEPNLDYMWHGASAAQYGVYLAHAHRVIKAADPDAKVVFGGLGGGVGQQVKWFRESVAAMRAKHPALPFDIVNFHIYPGEADNRGFKGADAVTRYLDSSFKQIEKALTAEQLAELPLWITEFDYSANVKLQPDPAFSGGPPGQAKLVKEILPRLAANHPDRKIFWASLLDDFNDPGFESMGLVTSNKRHDIGTPRPSYRALKELLAP